MSSLCPENLACLLGNWQDTQDTKYKLVADPGQQADKPTSLTMKTVFRDGTEQRIEGHIRKVWNCDTHSYYVMMGEDYHLYLQLLWTTDTQLLWLRTDMKSPFLWTYIPDKPATADREGVLPPWKRRKREDGNATQNTIHAGNVSRSRWEWTQDFGGMMLMTMATMMKSGAVPEAGDALMRALHLPQ